MRTLNVAETEGVAGGDWSLSFDLGFIEGTVSGDESAQDLYAGASAMASDAYWGARDTMADFYEWAANGWNYSMACAYQYY